MVRFFLSYCAIGFVIPLIGCLPLAPQQDEQVRESQPLMEREDLFEGDITGIDVKALETLEGRVTMCS